MFFRDVKMDTGLIKKPDMIECLQLTNKDNPTLSWNRNKDEPDSGMDTDEKPEKSSENLVNDNIENVENNGDSNSTIEQFNNADSDTLPTTTAHMTTRCRENPEFAQRRKSFVEKVQLAEKGSLEDYLRSSPPEPTPMKKRGLSPVTQPGTKRKKVKVFFKLHFLLCKIEI